MILLAVNIVVAYLLLGLGTAVLLFLWEGVEWGSWRDGVLPGLCWPIVWAAFLIGQARRAVGK